MAKVCLEAERYNLLFGKNLRLNPVAAMVQLPLCQDEFLQSTFFLFLGIILYICTTNQPNTNIWFPGCPYHERMDVVSPLVQELKLHHGLRTINTFGGQKQDEGTFSDCVYCGRQNIPLEMIQTHLDFDCRAAPPSSTTSTSTSTTTTTPTATATAITAATPSPLVAPDLVSPEPDKRQIYVLVSGKRCTGKTFVATQLQALLNKMGRKKGGSTLLHLVSVEKTKNQPTNQPTKQPRLML